MPRFLRCPYCQLAHCWLVFSKMPWPFSGPCSMIALSAGRHWAPQEMSMPLLIKPFLGTRAGTSLEASPWEESSASRP